MSSFHKTKRLTISARHQRILNDQKGQVLIELSSLFLFIFVSLILSFKFLSTYSHQQQQQQLSRDVKYESNSTKK